MRILRANLELVHLLEIWKKDVASKKVLDWINDKTRFLLLKDFRRKRKFSLKTIEMEKYR